MLNIFTFSDSDSFKTPSPLVVPPEQWPTAREEMRIYSPQNNVQHNVQHIYVFSPYGAFQHYS